MERSDFKARLIRNPSDTKVKVRTICSYHYIPVPFVWGLMEIYTITYTKNQRQEGQMFILIKRCNLFCKQKTRNPNQTKHCLTYVISDATLTALCTIYPEIYLSVNEPFWNIDNVRTCSHLLKSNVNLCNRDVKHLQHLHLLHLHLHLDKVGLKI